MITGGGGRDDATPPPRKYLQVAAHSLAWPLSRSSPRECADHLLLPFEVARCSMFMFISMFVLLFFFQLEDCPRMDSSASSRSALLKGKNPLALQSFALQQDGQVNPLESCWRNNFARADLQLRQSRLIKPHGGGDGGPLERRPLFLSLFRQ